MKNKIIFFLIFFKLGLSSNSKDENIIPNLKLKMLDGKKTTIHELVKDGPIMIDFWATWCVPCKKVMKYLDQYHQNYADKGFQVLMINQDTPRSIGKVKSYIRSQNHQFLVSLDPNQSIAKKLNGLIMPTLILVDKGGAIKWRHQGYVPGEEVEIQKQIEDLIKANEKEGL
tara:strand:+ start:50 stop:562 length:513 start_codon:yes stop_codon:yes gene_type:complete